MMAMARDGSTANRTGGRTDRRRIALAADKLPVRPAAVANNYKHYNSPATANNNKHYNTPAAANNNKHYNSPAAANNNKPYNPPAVDPSKSRHGGNGGGGGAVTFANVQRQTAGGSNVENVPLLFVNKHRNQYDIQMNPMPYRNKDGEWVRPNNAEPVIVKLAKCDAAPLLSSQSSLEFEVMPQYDKSAKQRV